MKKSRKFYQAVYARVLEGRKARTEKAHTEKARLAWDAWEGVKMAWGLPAGLAVKK